VIDEQLLLEDMYLLQIVSAAAAAVCVSIITVAGSFSFRN